MFRTTIVLSAFAVLYAICPIACAEEYPVLSLVLKADKETLLPGERASVSIEITNTGTIPATRYRYLFPRQTGEYTFVFLSPDGNEVQAMNAPDIPNMPHVLNPQEKAKYEFTLTERYHFNESSPPGEYSLWLEYAPQDPNNPDIPPLAKSNVLKFNVEQLNIVNEKIIEKTFLDLGFSIPIKRQVKFKAFVHKGKNSRRLYWTRLFSDSSEWERIQIADNVNSDKWQMVIDDYGNTHILFQTSNGRFYNFTAWNATRPAPGEMPVPEKYCTEEINVPSGHIPQFKVTEGKVVIDYIPVSHPPAGGDNHQPQDGGEGRQNGAGQGVTGETPSAAEATPFPWAIVIVVAIAALATGAITVFLLNRKKRREA